jgi:tetratricopeptide (TPR) repeat protein
MMGGFSPLPWILLPVFLILFIVGPLALLFALLSRRVTWRAVVASSACLALLGLFFFFWVGVRTSRVVHRPASVATIDGSEIWAPVSKAVEQARIAADTARATRERAKTLARRQKDVAAKPNDDEAQYNLGQALVDVGQFAEALGHYQKALQRKPDFVAAYVGLGDAVGRNPRTVDLADAVRSYQMALKLDPKCAMAHRGLAAVLVRQNQFDEAIAEYRRALAIEPEDTNARENLDKLVQQQSPKLQQQHSARGSAAASQPTTAVNAAASVGKSDAGKQEPAKTEIAKNEANKSKSREPHTTVDQTRDTAARPAWVDAAPRLIDDAYQMVVSVGPYTSLLECDAKLPEAIGKAVDEYAKIAVGPGVVGTAWLPDAAFCRRLIKDRWEEVKQYSVGPMTQLYVLLEFDHKAKGQIADALHQGVIERRVAHTVAGMAAVLGGLALLYGGLRVTAPRAAKPQS